MGRTKIPQELVRATIDHLTPSGLGVAMVGGRRTRIANALPAEAVEFHYLRRHRGGDDGIAMQVANLHPDRITPRCPHTGRCGGCTLQHLRHPAQIRLHQAHLEACLAAVGGPARWLAPITADVIYGYRRKARLGVKFVDKRDLVLVGFRERGCSLVTEIESCVVLHPAIGERIVALRMLITSLEARRCIPQIEVAIGEEVMALIFRHTAPLSPDDRARLLAFAANPPDISADINNGDLRLQIFLQAGGLDTITPLWPELPLPLEYYLPTYSVSIAFQPTDFTQVNFTVNRMMIEQVVSLLELQRGEAILDLYCGLGNFTLPLARSGARVIGIDGDAGLVARARTNAQCNGLVAEFISHDLNRGLPCAELHGISKALLDPPRSGAASVLPGLAALGVTRIVYVSCNPETLGRDAMELVHQYGYRLEAAGVMEMFPHTSHMESIAVFSADREP